MVISAREVDRPLEWYNRYAHHIALDQVGEGGQLALNAARVLVLGAQFEEGAEVAGLEGREICRLSLLVHELS